MLSLKQWLLPKWTWYGYGFCLVRRTPNTNRECVKGLATKSEHNYRYCYLTSTAWTTAPLVNSKRITSTSYLLGGAFVNQNRAGLARKYTKTRIQKFDLNWVQNMTRCLDWYSAELLKTARNRNILERAAVRSYEVCHERLSKRSKCWKCIRL